MPFKSQSQRALFYAKRARGEISPEVVKEWEDATPKGKLPYRVKKAFAESFSKTAGMADKLRKAWNEAPTLDKAGLGLLAVAPGVHTYKAIKEKDPGQAALGASELGGLGLLYRSVKKAHS